VDGVNAACVIAEIGLQASTNRRRAPAAIRNHSPGDADSSLASTAANAEAE